MPRTSDIGANMHLTLKASAALLLAGAGAFLAAPSAAADQPTCNDFGLATQCVSPGNSQIIATPPFIQHRTDIIIINRHR
jgi:hypothetical protein